MNILQAIIDLIKSLFRQESIEREETPSVRETLDQKVSDILDAVTFPGQTEFDVVKIERAFNVLKYHYDMHTLDGHREAHFFAQAAHETGGFRWATELGSEKYFSKYDGRLGNTQPGDGAKYKGRGIFQLTGRYNYTVMAQKTGLDLVNNPELAAEEYNAVKIALIYWKDRNLNRFADKDDVIGITKAINGGTNGLNSRINYLKRAKKAVGLPI